MKKLLAIAALGETATGLVLLVYPPIVVWLLFGAEMAGASVVMSRITGIALIGLGVACCPDSTGLHGLLACSALVTLYLLYLGFGTQWNETLLWPAIVLHSPDAASRAGFVQATTGQINLQPRS